MGGRQIGLLHFFAMRACARVRRRRARPIGARRRRCAAHRRPLRSASRRAPTRSTIARDVARSHRARPRLELDAASACCAACADPSDQRRRRRPRGRPRRLRHHEVRRRRSAPAAARGRSVDAAPRRGQRVLEWLEARPEVAGVGRSRSRPARATSPRARSIAASATRRSQLVPGYYGGRRDERAHGQGLRPVADGSGMRRRCAARPGAAGSCGEPGARVGRRAGRGHRREAMLPLASKRDRREQRRVRRLAPRAAFARSVEAHDAVAFSRPPAPRPVFNAGAADADRGSASRRDELGRDRRRQDDRPALAARHRPDRRRADDRDLARALHPAAPAGGRAGPTVSACSRPSGCATATTATGASSSTAARPPPSRWQTARRPSGGSRSRRCPTAPRSEAPSQSGADHAALAHAALGAAEGGIERQAVARQQHVDGAVERRGGAGERFALRGDLAAGAGQALAQRRRQRAARCAASENWLDRAREGAMQFGGVEVDAGADRARAARRRAPPAASRPPASAASSRAMKRVGVRRDGASGVAQSVSACTLPSSSWALAISLSAIASAFTLNDAVGDRLRDARRPCSASNSREAPPDSRVDAVLDSSTSALASSRQRAGGADARGRGLAAAFGRAAGAPARRRTGCGLSAGLPIFMVLSRGRRGGRPFTMDGVSARRATTLGDFWPRLAIPAGPFTAPAPAAARRRARR